ncbi:hypothetical protein Bca52824_012919 [Brassica carinata]|uniref:Uncharacterized protein n=1 Tax=Brassica carinata TaxID=52824 RepID=A0A8X7VYF7_BRACI|nr:hypothetical protein Bca52824_012919 [Brassica carinata]
MANFSGLQLLFFSFIIATGGISVVSGAVFTIVNSCSFTVWPGILTAPAGWSGRTGANRCNFDALAEDVSPETVVTNYNATVQEELHRYTREFTIGHGGGMDFYDVSLVDGYNVQMEIKTQGGSGDCQNVGCVSDLNRICPNELSVRNGGSVVACKSACAAFDKPEFCCTGQFNQPETCPPTDYSRIFKTACPKV